MWYLKPSTAVYVVYANIALYCLCFQMQQPVLPYRTKQLGATTAEFAQFQSLFNLAQSVGGLFSGAKKWNCCFSSNTIVMLLSILIVRTCDGLPYAS
jgi:hypothetical protein